MVVVVVVVIAAYTSRGKNPGPPGNYLLISVGAAYPQEALKTKARGGNLMKVFLPNSCIKKPNKKPYAIWSSSGCFFARHG